MRHLDLVVGSNGAGKSTFIRLTLSRARPDSIFVNADEIAKREWPDDPEDHSYEAAEVAGRLRQILLSRGERFIAETVFSHPSKLDLITEARASGYTVALHVLLLPEELTLDRVAVRVRSGGHSVPEVKVRERYARLWAHVATAIEMVDTAEVYDNSDPSGPRLVALFSGGEPVGVVMWPSWTPAALAALDTEPHR